MKGKGKLLSTMRLMAQSLQQRCSSNATVSVPPARLNS